jgi:hypothetical protein
MAQAIEYLLCKCNALSSNPNPTMIKKIGWFETLGFIALKIPNQPQGNSPSVTYYAYV